MSNGQKPEKLPASMDIAELVPALAGGGWRGRVRDWLHRVLGLYAVHGVFSKAREVQDSGGANVFLGVLYERDMPLDLGDLKQRIPDRGSVVVVANHVFGGADAIALSGVCAECRPDTKVLANAMISGLPGMAHWTIPLQIMGGEGATGMNRVAMKASLDHLRAGGLLVVFPAGAVSRWRNDLGKVADPEWSAHIARLAQKTDTPVLPVRVFGKNPLWFELLGTLHPLLRSSLIVRAFLTMKGKTIRCRAGKMIDSDTLKSALSAEDATQIMRGAVEAVDDPR